MFNLKRIAEDTGGKWTPEQVDVIRQQVAPDADPYELVFFLTVAANRGLDPFAREIHAVHRWDSRAKRKKMAIQVGIDGYRKLADATGTYAGNDDPVFGPSTPDGYPSTAQVTVWRIVAGQRVPFAATARWEEYVQTGKDGTPTTMWRKMPHVMLAKCAEALALRKAFPGSLSGLYTNEEMSQQDSEPVTVQAKAVRSVPQESHSKPAGEPIRDEVDSQAAPVKNGAPEPLRREVTKLFGRLRDLGGDAHVEQFAAVLDEHRNEAPCQEWVLEEGEKRIEDMGACNHAMKERKGRPPICDACGYSPAPKFAERIAKAVREGAK